MRRLLAIAAGLAGLACWGQAASGVALVEDDVLRRNGTTAPLFSFASPTAFRGYAAYAGLPATDGCYAAASVTGTKGEALTFTRATTRFCPTDGTANEATGVMCTSGQVCISTLSGKRGISIYRAGTNKELRSEEWENVAWTDDTGVTVSANDAACPLAPGGAQTMDLVTLAGASGTGIKQSVTVSAGAVTRSLWVSKKTGGAACTLGLTDSAETLGVTTVTVTAAPVRWANTSTEVGTSAGIYLKEVTSGDCTDVCVWGGQVENSAYATPYVATTSAAATRNAEAASFAGRGVGGPMSAAASIVLPTNWAQSAAGYSTILNNFTTSSDYWLMGHLSTGPQAGVEAYPGAKRSVSGATGTLISGRWWAYQDGTNLGAGTEGTAFATTTKSAVSNGTLWVGAYQGSNFHIDGIISNVCVSNDSARCR